jgi:hypothetical protein
LGVGGRWHRRGTTDAGRTWREIGTSIHPSDGKIRFADPRYGYQLDSAGIYAAR